MPMTAQGWAISAGLQDADEVLLQARTGGRVGDGARGLARVNASGRLADAKETRDDVRPRGEGTSRRVDLHRVTELHRITHEDLLMRIGSVELRDVDATLADAGLR